MDNETLDLDGIRNKREGCGKRNIAGGYDIVGSDIRFCTFQCQTRLCIVHFHQAAQLPVVPVRVISGIGLLQGNLVKGTACNLRNHPHCLGCHTCGQETYNNGSRCRADTG